MNLHQSQEYGQFMSKLGWQVERIGQTQVFIKKLPVLPWSLVKIQRPTNPLPLIQLDQLAKKYKALFILIEPDLKNWQEKKLLNHGYRISPWSLTPTATIQLDLNQTPTQLWDSLSENARRNIKKAQTNLIIETIQLEKISIKKVLPTFYHLLKTLSDFKKFYIPDISEFNHKLTAFKNNSRLYFAYQPGFSQPIAFLWVVHLKDSAHYLQTGSTKTGYQFLANYLLTWEAIQEASKQGLAIFDFEGIFDKRFPKERRSWINFSQFKQRFHGKVIEYPYPVIKFYNPIFQYFMLWSAKIFKF